MKSYADQKITIAEMEVPPLENEFAVQIMEPGIVRHIAFKLKPRALVSAARGGQPEYDAVLSFFVEVSPGSPLRSRRFVVLSPGQVMNPVEGHDRVYVGTALLPQVGEVAHVYEIKKVQS